MGKGDNLAESDMKVKQMLFEITDLAWKQEGGKLDWEPAYTLALYPKRY